MESYHQEIIRKRRSARVFWLIVFAFATLLYFFFQGYYPNISLGLKEITGSGHIADESIVKAFGIINVKVNPGDTTMLLNSGSYTNNEKKMVNYGDYALQFSRRDYLPTQIHFSIGKEKPYLIEDIFLLPEPQYQEYVSGSNLEDFTKISESKWLATASGSIYLLGESFSGTERIMSGSFHHIGDGYFLSGNTLVRYDEQEQTWSPVSHIKWAALARRCDSPTVTHGLISCQETREAITPSGHTLTGVVQIDDTAVQTDEALYFYEKDQTLSRPISLSGVALSTGDHFFQEGDTPYRISEGSTGAIDLSNTGDILPLPLEDILEIESVGRYRIMIGSHSGSRTLWVGEGSYRGSGTLIPFPDIPLKDLRIKEITGNLWIKTSHALLFVYRGSNEIKWIIDGNILAWSDIGALYRIDDGTLWRATWESPSAR